MLSKANITIAIAQAKFAPENTTHIFLKKYVVAVNSINVLIKHIRITLVVLVQTDAGDLL